MLDEASDVEWECEQEVEDGDAGQMPDHLTFGIEDEFNHASDQMSNDLPEHGDGNDGQPDGPQAMPDFQGSVKLDEINAFLERHWET